MRGLLRVGCCLTLITGALAWAAPREADRWSQVHPHWRRAYVISFRSPDLLSNEPDERWGQQDGRLVSGGILSDFPIWLAEHSDAIEEARQDGRPILLSIHAHSGYGAGIITYSRDLQRAEAVTYPWLMRQLQDAGLGDADVSVAVDTCNAQATAYYQIRPDLQPSAVAAWVDFKRWRGRHPARYKLPLAEAYRLFTQDHVAAHLRRPGRGKRAHVKALQWEPLQEGERREFRAQLYGPKGVILATPAFFNLLRLGPNPRGTLTDNLLTAKLSGRHVDGFLTRNKGEFRRFTQFGFLAAAGLEDRGDSSRGRTAAGTPETRGGGRVPDSALVPTLRREPREPSSRSRRD